MNVKQTYPGEQRSAPANGSKLRLDRLTLPCAVASIGVTFLVLTFSHVCACGYMTPRSLPNLGVAALFAWIPSAIPGQKHWVTRVLTIIGIVFATAVFGKNLADVLWLSPHAGHWSH